MPLCWFGPKIIEKVPSFQICGFWHYNVHTKPIQPYSSTECMFLKLQGNCTDARWNPVLRIKRNVPFSILDQIFCVLFLLVLIGVCLISTKTRFTLSPTIRFVPYNIVMSPSLSLWLHKLCTQNLQDLCTSKPHD